MVAGISDLIEVAIGFDTTGSMYGCLAQVRRNVNELVRLLLAEIPGIRIAILAHGDYCDARLSGSYVIQWLDLSSSESRICDFVTSVGRTDGGDLPECYELELKTARTKISWTAGARKVLLIIGDNNPHGPREPQVVQYNQGPLDWRNELGLLKDADVHVYGVQALGRDYATDFFQEVARKTNGVYLELSQFNIIEDLILAVCFKQAGNERLQHFETQVRQAGRWDRARDTIFAALFGRKVGFAPSTLKPVRPGKFQVFEVLGDCPIREFVEGQGVTFVKGHGFYELTKAETIQNYKDLVLVDRETGDMFTDEATIRNLLGIRDIRPGSKDKIHLSELRNLDRYRVFVQSTSVNRRLKAGTTFLYDMDGIR